MLFDVIKEELSQEKNSLPIPSGEKSLDLEKIEEVVIDEDECVHGIEFYEKCYTEYGTNH